MYFELQISVRSLSGREKGRVRITAVIADINIRRWQVTPTLVVKNIILLSQNSIIVSNAHRDKVLHENNRTHSFMLATFLTVQASRAKIYLWTGARRKVYEACQTKKNPCRCRCARSKNQPERLQARNQSLLLLFETDPVFTHLPEFQL